ncbi:MAG: ABC transporter ATP-binding protein [Gammaproteobacteria bacterium]
MRALSHESLNTGAATPPLNADAAAPPLLSVRDLRVRFAIHGAALDAVRGVSFDIAPGGSVALVGESGSGKSVIARAIMGILPANATVTAGRIILTDRQKGIGPVDTLALAPNGRQMRSLRGGGISLIFQEPMVSLSALHTIGDQISEALFLHRVVGRAQGMDITRDMLGIVGFHDPARALALYPFELSGGMRQRAMIAMALVCRPSLLIADEPTTALDVTIQAQILQLMRSLQTQLNMAVLMITHDLGVVANIARQVVVLYHGEVMERGPVARIFSAPGHAYTRALLGAVPKFGMRAGERLVPLREIKAEIGGLLMKRRGENRAPPGQPPGQPHAKHPDEPPAKHPMRRRILKVRGLAKSFGARASAWSLRDAPRVHAVRDVSFDLRRGECLGLVGESGSGKSTLGKLIVRALSADSGRIEYRDAQAGDGRARRVEAMKPRELFDYRCKVQYIFQDPVGSLNPGMTLFDIIREPMQIHRLGGLDYQMEMCGELMRLVGLDPRHLRRYPHSFSGGQRQRVGIARALALQPELLICDEPVSALDVSIQAQVLNLMKDLQRELHLSYLFISHNLAVVDYIAERIAVMYRGQIVELAARESLFARPTHPYTRMLLRAIPVADLAHPLDFEAIAARATERDWPAPFDAGGGGRLFEIAPGHSVRALHQPQAAAA